MPVDKPVIRNNYFFQIVQPSSVTSEWLDQDELSWSNTVNGPEDSFRHGHPFDPSKNEKAQEDENKLAPTPATMRLRTERQTLRRLPKTGAIIFTIRTYLFPVEELGKERGVPGRMASSVRAWGPDVQR
jgi:hypothetical protein